MSPSLRPLLVASSLGLALLSAACSGGTSSSSSDAGSAEGGGSNSSSSSNSNSGSSSGAFSLSVASATATTSLNGVPSKTGDVFIVVDVTFTNTDVPAPLPLSPIFFTVSTTSSLVVDASPSTAATSTPCRADVAVASGGTTICELAFELSSSDVPASVHYDDTRGHLADAALPTVAGVGPSSSACSKIGSLKNASSSACQSCIVAHCASAWGPTSVPPCDSARSCQSSCTTCSCMEACEPTNDCRAALDDLYSCLAASCAAQCE